MLILLKFDRRIETVVRRIDRKVKRNGWTFGGFQVERIGETDYSRILNNFIFL